MTNELDFMKQTWSDWLKSGPVRCIECNKELWFHPAHVSHVLPKGAYPALRLDAENVVPMCFNCHQTYEFGARNKMKVHEKLESIKTTLKQKMYEQRRNPNTFDIGNDKQIT